MSQKLIASFLLIVILAVFGFSGRNVSAKIVTVIHEPTTKPAMSSTTQPVSPLDFSVKDIDGKDVNLSDYRGKVVMIVNVASKCGNTPQYAALENLYKTYSSQGFVIIGFPANNFGHQEPGSDMEIKTFCTGKYDVTFPMMSKISVKGADIAPPLQVSHRALNGRRFRGRYRLELCKICRRSQRKYHRPLH